MHTFQNLVSKLVDFWADKGCIIHQGHDVEVGAGTFNPATFFRCLGPEPYSTVYVEPSRRPQDGRYGENPNRLQLFHQLQVIIKPSPLDAQKLYLESLEAVGFDLSKHDIRFVHDDWESPTLGAWGLGWEVWIDGMEITQFTYFQAVASMQLKPITVELTYGLERLAMILQGKKSLFDMQWNETYTYEDVVKQNEVEWSTYNFEAATPDMWLRHFDDHEKEAKMLIEKGLPIPAYDFVLKGSHDFNMLEARGVLSVTERAGYIARVRDLSRAVAECYVERREACGYPLLRHIEKTELPKVEAPEGTFDPTRVADFVLEIGSEELPAGYVQRACADLKRLIIDVLSDAELPFDQVDVHGTPRRLTVYIQGLGFGSHDAKEEKRGPPLSIAFDESGSVTKQGQGFFKSINTESASLEDVRNACVKGVSVQEVKGSEYLFAMIEKKGKSAAATLSEKLPRVIEQLAFPKKMRWADLSVEYARPLSWIVALHGTDVIPLAVGSIVSGRRSYGHFQRDNSPIDLADASDYFDALKKHCVLVRIDERSDSIEKQLTNITKELDCAVVDKEKVRKEVLFLSEYPELVCAEFDSSFLEAPKEVLISEMVEHQRYFPLVKADGSLLNRFVITADNTPSEFIVDGNRRVLSARLSDGVFLCKQDLKHPLTHFAEKLSSVIFQKKLGTMQEKASRIEAIALAVNEQLGIAEEEPLKEAAYLCKADLTTELVGEFPELQGMVGRYYAQQQGLKPSVASAIEEHWMPRSEKSDLPMGATGIVLSIADRIDNLCSYFKVGLKPTSSSDPFALRRATLGLLRIVIEQELSLDLETIVQSQVDEDIAAEVMQFITTRAKTVFLEYGLSKDEIEASLAECVNPYDQYLRVLALHGFRKTESFAPLFEVYKRAKGQLSNQRNETLIETVLEAEAEKKLLTSIREMDPRYDKAIEEHRYKEAYSELATLQKPLATLFDEVKILDENESIRKNRIALLQEVFSRFNALLDFSKIKG